MAVFPWQRGYTQQATIKKRQDLSEDGSHRLPYTPERMGGIGRPTYLLVPGAAVCIKGFELATKTPAATERLLVADAGNHNLGFVNVCNLFDTDYVASQSIGGYRCSQYPFLFRCGSAGCYVWRNRTA